MAKTLLERFNEKYMPEPMSGCWLWTAADDGKGYGVIRGRKRQQHAYRVSYELFVGPIPVGLVIDHKCRVPACVNPDHLEAVTQKENLRRGIGSAASKTYYAARTHCKNGHELTAENTYFGTYLGYTRRFCRDCGRARGLKYLRKKRC